MSSLVKGLRWLLLQMVFMWAIRLRHLGIRPVCKTNAASAQSLVNPRASSVGDENLTLRRLQCLGSEHHMSTRHDCTV